VASYFVILYCLHICPYFATKMDSLDQRKAAKAKAKATCFCKSSNVR
jgi:hypothetical protein